MVFNIEKLIKIICDLLELFTSTYLQIHIQIRCVPKKLSISLWVMLTNAPGALVKNTKTSNFYIENSVFYLSKM
jgi:hypothetical protein